MQRGRNKTLTDCNLDANQPKDPEVSTTRDCQGGLGARLGNKSSPNLTMSMALWMILDWSTPMTALAPALAANMERMPVPQPMSRTTWRGE